MLHKIIRRRFFDKQGVLLRILIASHIFWILRFFEQAPGACRHWGKWGTCLPPPKAGRVPEKWKIKGKIEEKGRKIEKIGASRRNLFNYTLFWPALFHILASMWNNA